MKKRVLVFTNEIAPYRIPFFNRLHQERAYEFLFVFNHIKSWRRHWRIDLGEIGFRYHVLGSPRPHRESLSFNGIQVLKIYRDFNPHIVIIGGFYLNNLLALGMARILGKKIVFWGNSRSMLSGAFPDGNSCIKGCFSSICATIPYHQVPWERNSVMGFSILEGISYP
jgi:hypothetical protein